MNYIKRNKLLYIYTLLLLTPVLNFNYIYTIYYWTFFSIIFILSYSKFNIFCEILESSYEKNLFFSLIILSYIIFLSIFKNIINITNIEIVIASFFYLCINFLVIFVNNFNNKLEFENWIKFTINIISFYAFYHIFKIIAFSYDFDLDSIWNLIAPFRVNYVLDKEDMLIGFEGLKFLRSGGIYDNPNVQVFTNIMGLGLLLIDNKYNTKIKVFLSIFIIISTLLTLSRQGYALLFLLFLLSIFGRKIWLIYVFTAILIIILSVSLMTGIEKDYINMLFIRLVNQDGINYSEDLRYKIYQYGLNLIENDLILGLGYKQSPQLFSREFGFEGGDAHSFFLTVLIEVGILGTILTLVIIFLPFLACLNSHNKNLKFNLFIFFIIFISIGLFENGPSQLHILWLYFMINLNIIKLYRN